MPPNSRRIMWHLLLFYIIFFLTILAMRETLLLIDGNMISLYFHISINPFYMLASFQISFFYLPFIELRQLVFQKTVIFNGFLSDVVSNLCFCDSEWDRVSTLSIPASRTNDMNFQTFFFKNIQNSNYHYHIWIQHKDAFRWVQTSLVLFQWFLRQPLHFEENLSIAW